MNVSLDPEMIQEIIREQVNIQGDEDGQILESAPLGVPQSTELRGKDEVEDKSFFERVVEFVFRREIIKKIYLLRI